MFIEEFDQILKLHDVEKAKNYINEELEKAIINKDTSSIITILNEAIGFYRDLFEFDTSYKFANNLYNLLLRFEIDKKSLFISYINIANAFRANKDYLNAERIFFEAKEIYEKNNLNSIKYYAALFNNLGLLYQEKADFNNAIEAYNNALEIIENEEDEIKIATTYINIAYCYYETKDLYKLKLYLEKAKIFEDRKDDFHYSGYALLYARYLNLQNDINAIEYYESALASIFKNTGRNQLYLDVEKEYKDVLKRFKKDSFIKGLIHTENYFKSQKEAFFKEIGPLKEYVTIGLFGLGSEAYNLDDEISLDHDYNPDFIVLVEDVVSEENFKKIVHAYDKLDKIYKRFYIQKLDKKGVHYLTNYLNNFLGYQENSLLSKSLITNGKIFFSGEFASFEILRNKIIKEYRYHYLTDLIYLTLEINQYIPYNLNRAKERNKILTYKLLKNHLVDKLISYYYRLHNLFLMHDKLSLELIAKDSKIYHWIELLLNDQEDQIIFEEISTYLLNNLNKYNVINKIYSCYIEDYREELLSFIDEYHQKEKLIQEIVKLEWSSFSELHNIGGVASCQNNYPYFKLMREAQYYNFSLNLLKSYLNDLKTSFEYKYNLLAIKYGFMEETSDIEHFNQIKDKLPKLSEKFIALRESIIEIQIEMKKEFDEKYHNLKDKMRISSTNSDNILNVSYETYLRGELSSYSEKTLYEYAINLIKISKNNKNIVELIINYTFLLKTNETV